MDSGCELGMDLDLDLHLDLEHSPGSVPLGLSSGGGRWNVVMRAGQVRAPPRVGGLCVLTS